MWKVSTMVAHLKCEIPRFFSEGCIPKEDLIDFIIAWVLIVLFPHQGASVIIWI